MIVECPNCKSTFKVDQNIAKNIGFNFKCSVCSHTWKGEILSNKKNALKSDIRMDVKRNFLNVFLLNVIILALVVLALFIFKDKLFFVDNYWRNFYNFFYNLIPI